MKPSLLNALRKGTEVALKIDSIEIVLVPHLRVKKQGGVYGLEAQTPRPPQKFTVEPTLATNAADAGGGQYRGTETGATVHLSQFILTGRYDAQIAIGDVWVNEGTTYRVISLQPYNEYERKAIVSAIGADPKYGN